MLDAPTPGNWPGVYDISMHVLLYSAKYVSLIFIEGRCYLISISPHHSKHRPQGLFHAHTMKITAKAHRKT
jgi:hypothetical protein